MKNESIIVSDMDHCYVCGSPYVEIHHVMHGTANRKLADKYKLILPLCATHHRTGRSCPHLNRETDLNYQKMGQAAFEEHYGTREDFRRIFGKSVL